MLGFFTRCKEKLFGVKPEVKKRELTREDMEVVWEMYDRLIYQKYQQIHEINDNNKEAK